MGVVGEQEKERSPAAEFIAVRALSAIVIRKMIQTIRVMARFIRPGAIFSLTALLLIAACRGPTDIGRTFEIEDRSGFITLLIPSADNEPYKVDFSELDAEYYAGFERLVVLEPDLLFNGFKLASANGVVDRGRPLWHIFCPLNRTSLVNNESLNLVFSTLTRFLSKSWFDISPNEYSAEVPLNSCHLYILNTTDGKNVVLIHLGGYIGGINREHFFWASTNG
jgi:hypothetical protein